MTKISFNTSSFIVPITEMPVNGEAVSNDVFRKLLGGKNYVVIGIQILFEKEEQYYLTRIDNDQHSYTDEDYKQLPEGAPYHLINGKLVFMASPYDIHQRILGNLHVLTHVFVRKYGLGQVRFAPLDVHLDKENIYQPDLLFISNERKDIIKNFIYGAPDLVIEILSSNKSHDLGEKKENYGKYNVLEYWAIDYKKKTLDMYLNEERVMVLKYSYGEEEEVKSTVLKGFSFVLKEIFEE